MTPQEFQEAQAKLAEVDTEVAALDRTERDCIDRARDFNSARKVAAAKRTDLVKSSEPLRQAVAEFVQEVKRQQAEQARREAEASAAKARADAEARAKEQTPLDVLTAKVKG